MLSYRIGAMQLPCLQTWKSEEKSEVVPTDMAVDYGIVGSYLWYLLCFTEILLHLLREHSLLSG